MLSLTIIINGKELEMVQEIKYLRFYIDRQLTFDKDIDYISKRIGKKTVLWGRISSALSMYS